MAGGQKINDHKSWMGSGSNGTVLSQGVKTKMESSAEGAGHLSNYEDTTEEIKTQQMKGIAKAKSHPMKANYRN